MVVHNFNGKNIMQSFNGCSCNTVKVIFTIYKSYEFKTSLGSARFWSFKFLGLILSFH